MITRRHVNCRACGDMFVLRIGVAGGEQRFIFACPLCGVELRGVLFGEPGDLDELTEGRGPRLELRSEDFDELDPKRADDEGALAVTVYTDLPVPLSMQGVPARDAMLSPFILATQLCGQAESLDLWGRIAALRAIREQFFPALRRAMSLSAAGDLGRLPAALSSVPVADAEELRRFHPIYRLGRLTDLLYLPIGPIQLRSLAVGELVDLSIECERAHGDAYQTLLDDLFANHGLSEHRRRVIDTAMACLAAHDALLPPLVWERVRVKYREHVDDFQVMRDDFEGVGRRYQDVFELTSRTSAYLGILLNLRHRGDVTSWADGRSRSISTILNNTTAHGREFILNELPYAQDLINEIDRRTRNQIGHRLVGFDFRTQTLVDDQGNRVNYLVFLQDYLAAVRLTQYLLAVMEKLSVDRERGRTPQREDAGLPIGR